MKNLKKLASVALALVMAMALMVPAFAAGSTVTPTITISNASKGVTYYAYKLFDAKVNNTADSATSQEGAGIAYYYGTAKTVAEISDAAIKAMFEGADAVFQMNSIGQISKKDGVSDADVTAAVADWAKTKYNAGTANVPSVTGQGGAATINLGADNYGYYAVISDQSEAAVTVNSTTPTVTIVDKTTIDVPTIPDDAKTVTSTGATYALGETVSYRLAIPTTNWIRSTASDGTMTEEFVYQYVLTDTATAGYLSIDTNSVDVKVKANGADDSTAVSLTSAASITRDATTGVMTIRVPWGNDNTKTSYYANRSEIVVTYTATVTGTGKGSNALTATYNTTPLSGNSTEDVYNTSLDINKYDEATDEKLAGAKFMLKDSNDNYYKYTAASGNAPAKVEWVAADQNPTEVTTNATGSASFEGLKDGTYTLVETEAPAGYNKMDDMSVTVAGNDTNSYHVSVNVPNSTGAVLPATGGMGTTIFYAVGGVLLAGSAILFITKKRMGE